MSSFLVTGGAGFIGSNIVDRLVHDGRQVKVLDNFSTGKMANIQHNLDKIELIEGDLADLDTVRRAVDKVDYVLHQGALPSVPRSVSDPIASNNANINGTLNLLVAARDAGVKRLVFASSSSVYGNTQTLPKVEDMKPDPLSPYALTSWLENTTAGYSPDCMAWKRYACGISTSLGPGRTRTRSMPQLSPSS